LILCAWGSAREIRPVGSAELVEHAALGAAWRAPDFGQAPEEFFLVAAEVRRHMDDDAHDHVAARSGAHPRHAKAGQAQHRVRKRAARHLHARLVARDRRHLDFAAECGGGEGHDRVHVEVVAFAVEAGVGDHLDHDVEVPARPAVHAGLALVGDAQADAVVDARGNLDLDLRAVLARPLPRAGGALLLHDLPDAVAAPAAGDGDHARGPVLAHLAHLPGPLAVGARLGARTALCAGTAARLARLVAPDRDLAFDAGGRLRERHGDDDLQVVALPGPRAPRASPRGAEHL